ncbi:DUF2079 domain-containing protein [Synechococcus sp. LTW-R]|uniref:DUF2079 domain-containing protein n=1 Tax=Synechococcus sp. LTW-R TaxID=2751170 RepID=UPI0016293209|nr:DUF2079 domain-containing protein [Synechococcus sp. LTW-R]QNG28986.1 DUF2079 domain-containing protein [Synechococcus sp. LTW-R]
MTKRLNYLLIALAASLMLVIALGRWLSLASNAWDLGIFTQFSWMLSRGYFLEPASLTGWPVLADHASFVLVPISFLYRIWSSPAYLLTFQVFALTGASLVLLWLAKSSRVSPKVQTLLLLAYFFQPVLWNVSWFDFHPDSLFPLAVFFLWLQVRHRKLIWIIISLIFILSIRETSVLVVVGLSLTCFLQGKRKLSVLLACFAIAWTFFLSGFWYPLFFPDGHHNSGNYAHLFDAALDVYREPLAFHHLIQAFHAASLSKAPVFFLALIVPWLIFLDKSSTAWIAGSLVVLTPLALSTNPNQVSILYHYGMMIAPFFALAALESARTDSFLSLSHAQLKQMLFTFGLISVINFMVNLNLNPGWILFWRNPFPFLQYYERLSRIPAEKRVLTSNGLSAHIANRREADFVARPAAQLFPEGFDMLILNQTDPGFGSSPHKTDLLIQAAKKSGWTCDSLNLGHLAIQECVIK